MKRIFRTIIIIICTINLFISIKFIVSFETILYVNNSNRNSIIELIDDFDKERIKEENSIVKISLRQVLVPVDLEVQYSSGKKQILEDSSELVPYIKKFGIKEYKIGVVLLIISIIIILYIKKKSDEEIKMKKI